MSVGSKLQLEPGSWGELVYDVSIGFIVGAAHSLYLMARGFYLNAIRPVLESVGLLDVMSARSDANRGEKELKVVVVGYGRTGTVSTALARSIMVTRYRQQPVPGRRHLLLARSVWTLFRSVDSLFQLLPIK